jgi:hypothetical protein
MKTKSFIVVTLLLLPTLVFGQNLYDDLYSKPSKEKPLQNQQVKSATSGQDNQFRIESTRVGDKDVVVVRNMDGDTVYYSGDYANVPDTVMNEEQTTGEYANRINRFHNSNGTIIINDDNNESYPLDNVNWTVNVYGGYGGYGGYGMGYPYYNRYSPYGYWGGGWNSPWYSSYYGSYWDWNNGWDYPYYGGYYGNYWGGYPYYYGGWGGYYGGGWGGGSYGRSIPYGYTADSRRRSFDPSQNVRNSNSSRVAASNSIGSRQNSAPLSGTSTRSNSITGRGSSQNAQFWGNFLSNRGYNVSSNNTSTNNSRNNSSAYGSRGNSGSYNTNNTYNSRSNTSNSGYYSRGSNNVVNNSRGNYTNGGNRSSSVVVSVPSSSTRRSSSDATYSSSSRSSSSSSSNSDSGSRSSSSSSSTPSYSSGSSSSGSSYSGGGGGGGSRGGGGGRR